MLVRFRYDHACYCPVVLVLKSHLSLLNQVRQDSHFLVLDLIMLSDFFVGKVDEIRIFYEP